MYALGTLALLSSRMNLLSSGQVPSLPKETGKEGHKHTPNVMWKSWNLLANFQGILSEDSMANASTSDGSCSSLAG